MDERCLRQEMLAMLHDDTSVEPGLLASAHFSRGGPAFPVSAATAGADGGVLKTTDKLEVRVKEEPGTTRPSLVGRRESQKMDRALQELQVQREKMRREQEVWMAQEMSGLESKEAHLLALKLQHTTEMENLEVAKQEHARQQKVLEASMRGLQRSKDNFTSLMSTEREKLEKEKEAVAKEIAGMRSGVEAERQKTMAEVKSMRQKVSDRKQAVEEEAASLRRTIEREREDMERDVEAQRAAARGEVERLLAEAIAEREKAREVREAVESEMMKVEEKQLATVGKAEALEAGLAQLAEDRMKLKAEIEEEIGVQIVELRDERNEVRLEREALQVELCALNEAHARLAEEKAKAVSIQEVTIALQEAAKVVCKQTTQLKKERKRMAAARNVDTEPEAFPDPEPIVEPESVVQPGVIAEPEAGQVVVEKYKKPTGWLSRLGLFGGAKGGAAEEREEQSPGVKVHIKCLATTEISPPALSAGIEDQALVGTTPVKPKAAAVSGDKVVDIVGVTKKRTQQDMEGGGGEGQVAPCTPDEKEVQVEGHDAVKKAKVMVCMSGLDDLPSY